MRSIAPTITMEEALQPNHPWYELPVPWTDDTWTYRGHRLPDSQVAAAQNTAYDAGRLLSAHEAVRELVENDGAIPLTARLL